MSTVGVKNPNKKEARAENLRHRVTVSVNTATKTFKSAKDYNREDGKAACRNYYDDEDIIDEETDYDILR